MLLATTQLAVPIVEPVSLTQAKLNLNIDSNNTFNDSLISAWISAARLYAEEYTRRAFFNQQWQRTMDHFPTNYYVNSTINPSLRRDWPYYQGMWWNLTIALPKNRVITVDTITYTDQNGNLQTLSPDTYIADYNSLPCRLAPVPGGLWPFTQFYVPGSVAVQYTSGSFVTQVTETFNVSNAAPYTYQPLQSPITAISSVKANGNAVPYTLTQDQYNWDITPATLTFSEAYAGTEGTLTYYVGAMPQTIVSAIMLMVNHWYEHREASSMASLSEIPLGVTALLDMHTLNVLDYDEVV